MGWTSFLPRLAAVIWTLQPLVSMLEPKTSCSQRVTSINGSKGHVSAVSGGETFFYPNFHAPRDSLKLSEEIKRTVTRETGFQALMKVRCSNGLQVSSYHGNFLQHNSGADLEFGVIDADKAIGVLFSYDGKLESKLDAHFQSALLYTTASGERRVRCTNTVASVSEGAMESMKYVDQDAVVNIIAKEGKLSCSARISLLLTTHVRYSRDPNDREVTEGYTWSLDRKDCGYPCRLSTKLFWITSSRPIGFA